MRFNPLDRGNLNQIAPLPGARREYPRGSIP